MTENFGLDDGAGKKPSMLPFLAAFGVFLVVVIAIVVVSLTRGDGLTEEQRVGAAAVAQNDALQRANYADFQRYTCADQHGEQAEVLTQQQDSVAAKGARFVDDVRDVVIAGETATATVVYHFDKTPDTPVEAPMTFAMQNGQWTVCSPGPR